MIECAIEYPTIRFAREILALLLVSALLLATGAWTADRHRQSDDHPAGCHAIGGGSLAGSQADHQVPHSPERHECCLTGHDVAAIAVSYSFQPLISAHRVTVQITPEISTCFLDTKSVSMFSFADPPGMTALRI